MGCHHLVESVLLLLGMVSVVVVGKPLPHAEDDSNDCRIQEDIEVSDPSEVHLLTYISRSLEIVMVFIYPAPVKDKDTRDAVTLTSTEAIHSEVRDGKTTNYPLGMPMVVPEGWNTFRLNISEKTLHVTLVQGEDKVHLFSILLKDTVSKMYAKGRVALCPQASPEWVVAKGEEVNVTLQSGTSGQDQWLEVIAGVSADPYFRFPFTKTNKIHIPANGTLKVNTTLLGDHVLLCVFKTGENGDEEVDRNYMPLTLPWSLVVGNALHVRLTLFQPQAVIPADLLSPPSTPAESSPSSIPIIPRVLGGILAAMVVVVVLLVILMKKRLNTNKQDENGNFQMTLLLEPFRQDLTGNNIVTYTEEGQQNTSEMEGQQETSEMEVKDPLIARSNLTVLKEPQDTAEVKVFGMCGPNVRKDKMRRSNRLPTTLPNEEEVTLKEEDIQAGNLDNIRDIVANLQPNTGGLSRIEFTGKMNARDWKSLLLHLEDVKVRTVTRPVDVMKGQELVIKNSSMIEHQFSD